MSAAPPLSPRRIATAARWRSRRFFNWAFTYANLAPYGFDSPEAWLFLATNVGFFLVGVQLGSFGDVTLGAMCEAAGTASCWYHYQQVVIGGNRQRVVQEALLIDYLLAIPTLVAATGYASDLGSALPTASVLLAAAAFVCLAYGCREVVMYEQPRTFMIVHGAWHLLLQASGSSLVAAHAALGAG